MKLKKKIIVENNYSGSNWNYEITTKYVFEINGAEVEAGYFEHYKDDLFIKAVLELPQSYGCPTGCRFCASSSIEGFIPLDYQCLEELFLYLYHEHHLSEQKYVLLTMTGMGDIFFNIENVEKFLSGIQKFRNVHVTLSSCLWNVDLLKRIEKLNGRISIRNVQITYVSDQIEQLMRIVPFYQDHEYGLAELIRYIKVSEKKYYRLNYIMIKGVNDEESEFCRLCGRLEEISDKVVVRISKLNETGATRRNQLLPADKEAMLKLQGILTEAGIRNYIFYAHKNDNMNCGQLITENKEG